MIKASPAPVFSIVLPVYGEADHLAESLAVIRMAAQSLAESYELVVVDDGSRDSTWKVLRTLARQWPELRARSLSRNFGKEAAILAGLKASRGRAVVVMDADLQHPPELLPDMARLWNGGQGYAVVNALKRRRGDTSRSRGQLSRLYYAIFRKLAGIPLAGHSDFKLLDRRVVDAYCALRERNLFFRGLVNWIGYPQTDIVFDVAPRTGGGSKWSVLRLARMAADSVASFSTVPLHFISVAGLVFLASSAVLATQTLFVYLRGGAVEGFTTVILLLLAIGSVVMLALGVIGHYLAKIYEEVKERPRFLLREEVDGGMVQPLSQLPGEWAAAASSRGLRRVLQGHVEIERSDTPQ